MDYGFEDVHAPQAQTENVNYLTRNGSRQDNKFKRYEGDQSRETERKVRFASYLTYQVSIDSRSTARLTVVSKLDYRQTKAFFPV